MSTSWGGLRRRWICESGFARVVMDRFCSVGHAIVGTRTAPRVARKRHDASRCGLPVANTKGVRRAKPITATGSVSTALGFAVERA